MNHLGALAAIGLVCGLAVPLVQANAQTAVSEDLLALFEATALGPADRERSNIFRWRGDVTIRFTGQAAVRHRAWADEQIAEINALTDLDIQRIDSIGADVLVVFVDSFGDVLAGRYNELLDNFSAGEARREALLEGFRQTGAVCAGQIVAEGSQLTGGIIFIPRDQLSPVIRSCISTQLVRVLGLPFAAPEGAMSVLAGASPHSHLTGLDRLTLRLLYHPRMRAGMSRKDAATIARSVLPEVMAAAD
jgi:hypothetical protein